MPEQQEILSAESRERWTNKGLEELEKLEIPQGLKEDIQASLETPQYGAYHNEGPTLSSHIGKIMETIDAINQGEFRFGDLGLAPGQEAAMTRLVTQAIQENGSHMRVYAYLHDLKKPELMNIEIQYEEGGKTKKRQEMYTMDQYKELVQECAGDPACIDAKFKSMGVTKIGYRHSAELTGGEAKDHGETAEKSLRERGNEDSEISDFLKDKDLILVGVANHEMHFQVFSNAKSALQYEKNIASKFSDEEIGFIYAACLIDIAGSLKADGTSDFSGFQNMAEARECYLTIQEFVAQREQEGKPLRDNEVAELKNLQGLDKVQAKIESINNPPRTSLLPQEVGRIEDRLRSGALKDMGIEEPMMETVLEALRNENYAKALADLKLGKVVGFVKSVLREQGK